MSQLTRGLQRRLMYIENRDGTIYGSGARIGWVTFSKTGQTVYYRDYTFNKIKRGGMSGNFLDQETGDEYWISGIKKRGSNAHPQEGSPGIVVDQDAIEEYNRIKAK